jgi:DnaJ-class molecular chaperone
MEYTKRITCPECSGSGHLGNEVCFYCEGKGHVDAHHVDPYAYDLQWKGNRCQNPGCMRHLHHEVEIEEGLCSHCSSEDSEYSSNKKWDEAVKKAQAAHA